MCFVFAGLVNGKSGRSKCRAMSPTSPTWFVSTTTPTRAFGSVRHYTRVTERAAVAKDYLICILSVNVPTKRLLIAGLNRPAIAQRDLYCRRER